jgi:hypothetical protein
MCLLFGLKSVIIVFLDVNDELKNLIIQSLGESCQLRYRDESPKLCALYLSRLTFLVEIVNEKVGDDQNTFLLHQVLVPLPNLARKHHSAFRNP